MDDLRLNLSALRTRNLFDPKPDLVRIADLSNAAEDDSNGLRDFAFSRRQVLKSAGIAAVALAPSLKSAKAKIAPQLRGPFRVDEQKNCISFYLGDRLCWTIDAKRFGGSPKLIVDRTEDRLRVELKDALFPGTNLPADLTLIVKPRLLDCLMRLKMTLGGFSAKGSFEEWLAGDAVLTSPIKLSHTEQLHGENAALKLHSADVAEFSSEWKYTIRGKDVASYASEAAALSSNEATLRLPSENLPSTIAEAPSKRTLIQLKRGSIEWNVAHSLNPERYWQLDLAPDAFNQFTLEASEGNDGNSLHTVLLEQTSRESHSAFLPAGAYHHDGSQFRLPLLAARYATLMDGENIEHAFSAQFDSKGAWLHSKHASLLIGAPRSSAQTVDEVQLAPAFELYARNGELQHLHCQPEIHKILAPMPDAMTEAADVPTGIRLAFTHHALPPNPWIAQFPLGDKGDDENVFRFPANFVIGAVRTLDLLALRFEFINMEFRSNSTEMVLMKTKPKSSDGPQDSYLVVHFPAQNVAEQAFFQASPEKFTPPSASQVGLPAGSTYKPDASGNEPPTAPPVNARLAGGSRLAFYLPNTIKSLPYSLNGLLDWSQLQPSVVPVAFPPPPPPYIVYKKPAGTYNVKLQAGDVNKNVKVQTNPNLSIQPPPPILSDVRYRPGFTITANSGAGSNAISNIKQNTKSQLSQSELTDIQNVLGVSSNSFSPIESFVPGLLLDLTIRQPHLWETSLETPWRLMLSPNYYSGWAHAISPVGRLDSKGINWVELWHTRLGVKETDQNNLPIVNEQDDYYRTLRAVWSPDYNPNDGPGAALSPNHFNPSAPSGSNIFRMSLDARDRHELVELTSDFINLDGTSERIVRAEQFMMSSLGAWMNTRGAWEVPFSAKKPLSVEEWRHRSTMGRDHYVRVVYKGFLFPFGNDASLIKVTERKFQQTGNYMTCYLRQRMFIVVREPVKQYPAQYQLNNARQFPFTSIEIKTLVTPDLDAPSNSNAMYPGAPDPQTTFWPGVGGTPFLFHCIGTDWEGRAVEFTAPLGFIDNTRAYDFSAGQGIDKSIKQYLKSPDKQQIPFHGQKIAYADSTKPGDTRFETSSITFGAETPDSSTTTTMLGKADQPGFYPTIVEADIHIEAVKQITGMVGSTAMRYNKTFVENAWDTGKNKGQVFLELTDPSSPIGLLFGKGGSQTDNVGGFATPSMAITALSRLTGPVSGDIATAQQAVFDPSKFFQGLDPDNIQLFGGVTLGDILKLVSGFDSDLSSLKDQMSSQLQGFANSLTGLTADALGSLNLPKCPVPSFVSQDVYDAASQAATDVQNALKIPKQIQIVFKWDPQVQDFDPFHVNGDPSDTLSVTALILIPINAPGTNPPTPPTPGTPSYTVLAKIQNFTIDLFGIIGIQFNSVTFKMENGKKPDINADVANVQFEGPLSFINDLENIIPSDGFTDPPEISVTPTGVMIGYTLGIPSIGVGAFSLENISLGAELTLPFTGDPVRFRFHFCTQENPFLLTIYCFGGGGFFGIELGMDGVEMIEASFEFGASISIDLGVASGGVSVMAGIYFKLTKQASGDECQLTGFVQMDGNLDVLGIISISVEFYLALGYDSGPPKNAWGEASVTLKVKVLFFSVSVSASVRKEFDDPQLGFKDLFQSLPGSPDAPAVQWANYRLVYIDQYLTN